jgi:3D domain
VLRPGHVSRLWRLVAAVMLLAAGLLGAGSAPVAAAASAEKPSGGSGGASVGGLAPSGGRGKVPAPPSKKAHGNWLKGVTITEYWPAPESWFRGRLVTAPGLPGQHRIDWLYSATGLSMQGDGIGLDGQPYHIASLGSGGWVTATGAPTSPKNGWGAGSPFWRAGGFWRNAHRALTFPLAAGGWSDGSGRRYVPLPGASFAPGQSLPLRYYQSIAVDPRVIPLGSRVYVPAYGPDGNGGWFIAQDTGGAVTGRHIDVYRSPPASSNEGGQYLTSQRIYVIKPKR